MKRLTLTKQQQRYVLLGFIGVSCLIAIAGILMGIYAYLHPVRYIRSESNMLEVKKSFLANGEVDEDVFQIPRGAQVVIDRRGETDSQITYDGHRLTIPNENLVPSRKDCVEIESVYPRKLVNLRTSRQGKLSDVVAAKGEKLKVVSVLPSDLDPATGEISWFEVEKDGKNYWLAGTNLETTYENAVKDYSSNMMFNPVYDEVYGGGHSYDAYVQQTDLKGKTKVSWNGNPLRDDIQGIHITLENLIAHKDELIKLKNETGLNALVIALKGTNGKLAYSSEVPGGKKDENGKEIIPKFFNNPNSALDQSLISKEELKKLIQELKNAGFYIIGRLETFKDSAYAFDHPNLAISDLYGNPAYYSEDYWVSPYSREAWEYNGWLAKEAAEMGVNEVQFDFCRFPDGMTVDETLGLVDLHNNYNESKAAAIQGFLFYIQEELDPYHVYTASDIYGGPVIDLYDYDIGHFVPAMAAASDIVCPMIYLDTFDTSAYGFTDAATQSREILNAFTQNAEEEVNTVANPAAMRLWLQGYNDTTPERIAQEIQGIMDAGQSGYLLWTDRGDMATLDYLKEGIIESKPQNH